MIPVHFPTSDKCLQLLTWWRWMILGPGFGAPVRLVYIPWYILLHIVLYAVLYIGLHYYYVFYLHDLLCK